MTLRAVLGVLLIMLLFSCDDGDIIITDLDFDDQPVSLCTTVPGRDSDEVRYVFSKINPATQEALAFTITTGADILTAPSEINNPYTFTLGGTSDQVTYRRFNAEVTQNYFCSTLPPTQPQVLDALTSDEGTVTIITRGERIDNDNIPTLEENNIPQDIYDRLTDLPEGSTILDIDGDGIPNYYDFDDDGDNVLTSQEGVVLTTGSDGRQIVDYEGSRDSDEDGIPDFLDRDDDGDGVLTIYEDPDTDLNPRNNTSQAGEFPDYLNNLIRERYDITAYRAHNYRLTDINLNIDLQRLDFVDENGEEQTLYESYFFGEYEASNFTPDPVTPAFPQ